MSQLKINVLSYNLHKGFSPLNREFVLGRIRTQVRDLGADLVFLQEVLGQHDLHAEKWKDWPETSQFEFLADQMWDHHAYGRNSIYDTGHHGNAILSKFPFESWKNIDISTTRWDRRGFIHGVISIPNTELKVHLICTHLGLFESFRRKQISDLCQHIQKTIPFHMPLIVAGDFNDWREKISHILQESVGLEEVFLKSQGHHARSFPSILPMFRLDRIYTRGFQVNRARCYPSDTWSGLSDHLPMSAELLLGK